MSKINMRDALFIASALSFTACNDPVNGYFAPLPAADSTIGTGSVAGSPSAPVAAPSPVSPGGTSSGGTTSTCTPQMAQNLRIMLLIDSSGSTKSDDSGAKIRLGSMMNFITANSAATNLSYSFTYFYAAKNQSYDYTAKTFENSPSLFFGNSTQALGAVNLFQNTFNNFSGDGTDYQTALQTVGNLVSADNAANPGKYSYAVVFMSDGEPNVGPDTSSKIDPLVTNLINIVGPSRMTLSAVYFSNSPNSSDEEIIDKMAATGNGQYVNGGTANLNLKTMIQGILSVPADACPASS